MAFIKVQGHIITKESIFCNFLRQLIFVNTIEPTDKYLSSKHPQTTLLICSFHFKFDRISTFKDNKIKASKIEPFISKLIPWNVQIH